jgi:HipA-like protein
VSRALSVWWDGTIAGTLRVNQHGEMTFRYTPEWLADASRSPLSLSLPKRPEPFKQRECRPFFEGLLPEEAQRDAVARALGTRDSWQAVSACHSLRSTFRASFELLRRASTRPALDGKRATLEEIDSTTWPAFAAESGLGVPFVRRRVTELADAARSAVRPVAGTLTMAGLAGEALTQYAALITARAERLAKVA